VPTYVQAADEVVVDIVLEKLFAGVVFATPAPDINTAAAALNLVDDTGANSPHDNTEEEEDDGECSVVHGYLFRSSMTSAEVGVEDDDGHEQ
jgi:hypothetical protein